MICSVMLTEVDCNADCSGLCNVDHSGLSSMDLYVMDCLKWTICNRFELTVMYCLQWVSVTHCHGLVWYLKRIDVMDCLK